MDSTLRIYFSSDEDYERTMYYLAKFAFIMDAILVIHGSGNNGKSTFIEPYRQVYPNRVRDGDIDTFNNLDTPCIITTNCVPVFTCSLKVIFIEFAHTFTNIRIGSDAIQEQHAQFFEELAKFSFDASCISSIRLFSLQSSFVKRAEPYQN